MRVFGLPGRLRDGAGWGLFLIVLASLVGCPSAPHEVPRAAQRDKDPSLPCGRDEVREYFCDDLLPLLSSRPAPDPYDNCPASTEIRHPAYPPVGRVAAFEPAFTAYTRKRTPPGHSCCYGWCAKVPLGDPNRAAEASCTDSLGLPESFCMRELESGSSSPAASPYEHCPVAVKPPELLSFSAPSSALLDLSRTAKRRQDMGLADCCYAWCSQAPAGSVSKKKAQPKTK